MKLYNDEGFIIITQDSMVDDNERLKGGDAGAGADYAKSDKHGHIITRSTEKIPDKDTDIQSIKPGTSDVHDIPTIIDYLNWHMKRISENVIGRNEVITQAIYAILTGEHMLILSRTGMAKSYLATYIFNTFEGARLFSSQASKDQTPDNYFGPYNIEEFRKGRIKHNIKGSVIEANFVFLDEFFDASDVVLRSLLTVLNERKFINGQEQIDAAVHTAIATANYMRMNEVTEAVLDRFTYKSILPETSNTYTHLMIDHTYAFSMGKAVEPERKIHFNDILYLCDIIKNNNREIRIDVPDFIYFMKNILVNKFVSEMRKSDYNYYVSPRKQAKLADFLRASALLHNRFTVTMDDLKDMSLALCTLNSYISVKAKDKSEIDVFNDAYQQMMIHFKATGAIEQIEFLLQVRSVLQAIRENPDKRDLILQRKGLFDGILELIKKIFTSKNKGEDDRLTVDSLKTRILELNPVVEEVNELKDGILKDYRDIY